MLTHEEIADLLKPTVTYIDKMARVLDRLDLELREEKKIDRLIKKVEVKSETRLKKYQRTKPNSSSNKIITSQDSQQDLETPRNNSTPKAQKSQFLQKQQSLTAGKSE